ncbi:1-deoxy-D-xylulose-5-phosphate synthase [Aestuariirhabdus sp. LZHN29]|uniref:1-deoxy-D-xylulose-5-phosphate synthase n=1 Tax=Aestuariirhabdus sp. LZHN29 TaxID=3417462 RepID=UPI003CF7C860
MLHEIPRHRPDTPLLDRVDLPAQLRELDACQLPQLAEQLREYLLYCVGQTGGHFGAGLGVVELTIALHYIFNTPEDRLVWDVGHQAYPHKILTGRREAMLSLRQRDGLAAFPRRSESPYDTFGVGHSSTSISAALGMAIASRMQGRDRRAIAVIGDGAMTAGMAFEALNHASEVNANLLVVLNDNDMSISANVGGLSNYFARLLSSRAYHTMREGSRKVLSGIPRAWELARRTEEHVKGMMAPSTLFEELGFNYIGPIDGHNLDALVSTLHNMRNLKGPQFLHVVTQKGHGFAPAEQDPIGYHAITKLEPEAAVKPANPKPAPPKYSNVFGRWLVDMAEQESMLVGITPAMKDGSDLIEFADRFPDRYFDVAIAEQHAVTLAAGVACDGGKPVVAIYSTFLQRAYDQLIHDVAVQNLDVLFAIDRAGLVGEDGPTHAGCYDIPYMRCVPNMVIMTPADENETRQMLSTGYHHQGPAAVRYPRGSGIGVEITESLDSLAIGEGEMRREGNSPIAILAFGTLLHSALGAADTLDASVANMRFVKPLDEPLIRSLALKNQLLVTLEEGAIMGGAGSAVNEFLQAEGLQVATLNLGIPDRFIEHGKPAELLTECGLDAEGIVATIQARIKSSQPHKSAKL